MNATNCIHMPLKLSLSITPIGIGKMHQFFLSGNKFVAEKHTEKKTCPITNCGISKPWIYTQPIVTKRSLCYWKNTVTFRYEHIFINLSFPLLERSFGKRKEKKVLTSFLYLPFPEKLSASFWKVNSKLLAAFPEEQLKELREAEITVLLEDVGKVEVLSLTQSELSDTVEEVDCETFDETKSGFNQGLNSSFDCLPLLNLEARLSIFGGFKQIFFEAELVRFGLLFFLF